MGIGSRSWSALRRVPVWFWILGGGAAAFQLILLALRATDDVVLAPSLILLGSTIVPASVLSYSASDGRRILVPAGLVTAVAVCGGVLGTVAAGTVEHDALELLGGLPPVLIAVIEECMKLIVPLLVLGLDTERDSRYGLIVGVASAMGFASLETMGYAFQTFLESHTLRGVEDTLLLRALTAPAGHLAWTGLVCAAVWDLRRSGLRSRRIRVVRLLVVFAAAVGLHAAWDTAGSLGVHLVVAWVSFGSLLLAISLTQRRWQPRRPLASGRGLDSDRVRADP